MKKIAMVLCALLLAVGASYSFAEMHEGMMKGGEGKSGGMMEKGGMKHECVLSEAQTMKNMKDMMEQMSGAMDKMSGMMKTMDKEKMRRMNAVMVDMTAQMKDISTTFEEGGCSKNDMQMMKDRQKHIGLMMKEFKK